MYIGGTEVSKLYIGTSEVEKVYLGTEVVYQQSSPQPVNKVAQNGAWGISIDPTAEYMCRVSDYTGETPIDETTLKAFGFDASVSDVMQGYSIQSETEEAYTNANCGSQIKEWNTILSNSTTWDGTYFKTVPYANMYQNQRHDGGFGLILYAGSDMWKTNSLKNSSSPTKSITNGYGGASSIGVLYGGGQYGDDNSTFNGAYKNSSWNINNNEVSSFQFRGLTPGTKYRIYIDFYINRTFPSTLRGYSRNYKLNDMQLIYSLKKDSDTEWQAFPIYDSSNTSTYGTKSLIYEFVADSSEQIINIKVATNSNTFTYTGSGIDYQLGNLCLTTNANNIQIMSSRSILKELKHFDETLYLKASGQYMKFMEGEPADSYISLYISTSAPDLSNESLLATFKVDEDDGIYEFVAAQ